MAGRACERQSRGARPWFAALLILLIGSVTALPAEARPTHATMIVDAESGAVLYERNARVITYPASLTKMMTLYLLFEAIEAKRLGLDSMLSVSAHASAQPPTKIGVKAGGSISVEKAIKAIIVQSANDVAVVVGEALGGSERNFARAMTRKAQSLGMRDTQFRNASGLPDDDQVTTARDMAILARALISRFPDFYPYFATQSFTYDGRRFRTHNRVLNAYSGADGLKTGYIRASGFNLVTSAKRHGRRLIAIVLGGKTARARDKQMVRLLDKGFATLRKHPQRQIASLPPTPTAKRAIAMAQLAALVPPVKPDLAASRPEPAPRALSVPVADLIAPDDGLTPPSKPSLATATISSEAVEALLAPAAAAGEPSGGQPSYGIQVGAFSSYKPAHRVALKAVKQAPKFLQDARVTVDETQAASGRLYRARVVGLSQERAKAACKRLMAKSVPCLVFQTDLTLAMRNNEAAAAQ